MPVEYFIRYKGLCYDVGTRLRFRDYFHGYYWGIEEGVIEKFVGNTVFIRGNNSKVFSLPTTHGLIDFDQTIIEIIEPVYYTTEYASDNDRDCPSSWDIEISWIWYIIIMVIGLIFKDALMIWIFATAVFFLWKNGYLNGGKK